MAFNELEEAFVAGLTAVLLAQEAEHQCAMTTVDACERNEAQAEALYKSEGIKIDPEIRRQMIETFLAEAIHRAGLAPDSFPVQQAQAGLAMMDRLREAIAEREQANLGKPKYSL